jgi:hypothetical protein
MKNRSLESKHPSDWYHSSKEPSNPKESVTK